MAKQTQSKDQASAAEKATEKVVNNNPYAQEATKDAFGEVQDSHNPYSAQNTSSVQPVNEKEPVNAIENVETAEHVVNTSSPEPIIQPTVTDGPIKPTLTDNVVNTSTSAATSSKIQNKFGVVVGVSGMAARLLQNMDKNTKFVK
jgi:hypothetical protein